MLSFFLAAVGTLGTLTAGKKALKWGIGGQLFAGFRAERKADRLDRLMKMDLNPHYDTLGKVPTGRGAPRFLEGLHVTSRELGDVKQGVFTPRFMQAVKARSEDKEFFV